ncbi:protein kinase domain-containing protein [Thermocoleostomius sinensis]|uniref:non-specific serine/threonine protein kinase n=1 Tax=Thermocoleostomius sinensis A174 TaxID=2016057 RepID=A0A9E9CC33_9CYAN|nr:serine/threonine-protein kinase [Thermocoleostomius sinensis]WAL61850.1 serine/threonine-protein kinase [Thermocoleostomius sinensis A174]
MDFLRLFRSTEPTALLGGRYKVINQLGAGGFGQTFLAEDLHLPGHPRCVIKQLKPQFSSAQGLETAKRLFDTEAKVLYQLGDHDQIPRLLAHFEHNQEFYLAQELIVGAPLSEELINGQPWTEEQVVALAKDMLTVLSFVHQQGVIHRDIKPQNLIRRSRDGRVVLIDFGAVKQASIQLADADAGPTKTISIGTQGYMPSEQIAGSPRFSSDIYAVGKICIQALIGVAPRHLQDDPHTGEVRWRYLAPHVSCEFAEFLEQMVRYDFRARFSTAIDALSALEQLPIYAKATPLAPPPTPAALLDPLLQPTVAWSEPSTAVASDVVASEVVKATTLLTETSPPQELIGSPLINLPVTEPQVGSRSPTDVVAGVSPPVPIAPISDHLPEHHARSRLQGLDRIRTQRLLLPLMGIVAIGLLFGVVKLSAPNASSADPTSAPVTAPTDVSSDNPGDSTTPPNSQIQVAALQTQADQLRQKEQFQQAIVLYDQVISLNAKSAEAQWGRCYSLNRLLKPTEALAACNAALAVNPDYPEALWSKGYALDLQQKPQEALPLYERAIALKPDFAEAWSNKGTALFQLGRFEEALTSLNKAIELNPNLAEAWNNRGAVLWSLRRFDEAVASIDRAIQIKPDYQDALSLREQVRQRLGR